MALKIKDRVKELVTTTGTGDITLGGSTGSFEEFQTYLSNGDTTYYAIVHSSEDEWEVGLGTWNTGNTLSRTTVIASSNSNNAVNFSSGNKDAFMTYPADVAVTSDIGSTDLASTVTFGNHDTDDLAEGNNLYFTTDRIDNHLSGGTGVTYSTGEVSIGQDVGTTSDVTFASVSPNYIDLATDQSPSHSEGRIFYDNTNDALAVYNSQSDITLQVGQEEYLRVYNNTGSTITNGTPVYVTGEANDYPTIAKASASTEAASQAVGLATHDISNNSFGFVTVRGLVGDIDTSALTVGNKVHVGVTAGTLVEAAPTYPYFPVDVGICLISSASSGCLYVNIESHSFETIRITGNAHFDGNITIDGDLTVLGDQVTASSSNIAIGNAWNYFNAGDTIGALNTSFSGTGLDDASLTGHFTGTTSTTYYVRIDGVGTGTGGVDTFEWSTDNFSTTVATGVDITGDDQLIHSTDNIAIKFESTTGHTLGDTWTGTAAPVNVDTGFASNRNTGTSGIGYTHVGIFYDVSTNKWTVFDEYSPEPEGTIDITDSSFSYGTVKADTFEGDLDGDVTGTVSSISNHTTTELAEGTNLYYTTDRVNSAFDTRLATKTTTNLTEGTNLYYTQGRFDTAFGNKSTTDLSEGTNLYYTTTRANSDFDTRLATKTTSNLTEGSNLYYTTDRVNSAFDTRLANKTTSNLTEGSNLYYTTSRVNSAFDTRLATKSTTNLSEGDNLYYTTARANSAIDARVTTSYVNNLNINADRLDGQHASAFASANHQHVLADITDYSGPQPSFFGFKMSSDGSEINMTYGHDDDYDVKDYDTWSMAEGVTFEIRKNQLVVVL